MTWDWSDSLEGRFDRGIWVRCIFMGLPVWVRADEHDPNGCEIAGLLSWPITWLALPFNGELFLYDQVSRPWPLALLDWLSQWNHDGPEVGP